MIQQPTSSIRDNNRGVILGTKTADGDISTGKIFVNRYGKGGIFLFLLH